jgi:HDOD domain
MGGLDPSPTVLRRKVQEIPGPVARVTSLLDAAPVDLAHISDEIRSHPELEALALRMTASRFLLPENSDPEIEDAVVVLGTDRLRVLVYIWSTRIRNQGTANPTASGRRISIGGSLNPTGAFIATESCVETLYLECFLQWLGLDSPAELTSRRLPPWRASGAGKSAFAGLRNTLMRDFIALIPLLNPSLMKSS